MSEPRYTVGTVTGWPISEATLNGSRPWRSKPSTIAYVYDSAYCYRLLKEFHPHGHWGPKRNRITNVEAAQAFADKLNAEEFAPKPEPPKKRRKPRRKTVRPEHGHFTEYGGYLLYVIPQAIFIYDHERNLKATVYSMATARLVVQRLRRETRNTP